MRTPRDRDLARNRRHVQRTLSRHMDSPTIQWALRAVERDLFGYRATTRTELWIGDKLRALQVAGALPIEVLQRVLECYALRREEGQYVFPRPKVFLAFLARKVLLIKRGAARFNSGATQLAVCGLVIDDVLGQFATATLMRMDKDQAERDAFDASCEQLITS